MVSLILIFYETNTKTIYSLHVVKIAMYGIIFFAC